MSTLKRVAENLLFAAVVFIVFLVMFENSMAFPAWLKAAGRMHPMFLHFPIVILLLAMGMEFFRYHSIYAKNTFYQDFTSGLLLTGALFAAITVIMGLILSKENGYDGSSVAWHKWTGLGIVFLSSFMYWYRGSGWFRKQASLGIALLTVLFIVITGHLGSGITHGENFISAPLLSAHSADKVPLDKALVYPDIIEPIFKTRCVSCHNAGKSKGGLMLDNPEHIAKGGKSGKLYLVADAANSLIMERIHLPEDEKKHMPLTGKPQLTKDEKKILYYWIKSGASFKIKLTDLPDNDSLRLMALKFLAPATEELYAFEAADNKLIEKLNNNYRVIFPIARESPALVVDFFNKNQYSSKALEELLALKKQIIELNLNKMPVSDADLNIVEQFENLRILNLGFTNITGAGLSRLAALNKLKRLTLPGTKIQINNLEPIVRKESLKEISLWNTGITGENISQLRKLNRHLNFIEGFMDDGEILQLNPPAVIVSRNVFDDTIHIQLKHSIPGVQIRYTLDGSGPDSIQSPLFDKELILDKSTVLKARAFKTHWKGSDTVIDRFYKSAFRPDSIVLLSSPGEQFKGDGPGTLSDYATGDPEFRFGKWLGFQTDMKLLLQFHKPVLLREVAIQMLKNNGNDIFPPVELQIWGGVERNHLKLLNTSIPKKSVKGELPSLFLETCRFPATRLNYIKIIAVSVKNAPVWGYPPKKPGWIFADEIFLN